MNSPSLDAGLRWLATSGDCRWLVKGLRGFEKECLRVLSDGNLALTQHPIAWGSALTHPYLTTDYSESLVEFVTPPLPDAGQALAFLKEFHAFAAETNPDELLWPLSMPCNIGRDEDVPIAQYGTSNEGRLRTIYRSGLGYRYGRSMQTIAGIHFNFSVSSEFWAPFRDFCEPAAGIVAFRSERLMGLVRNYRRYGWLVTYLFGASPAFSRSFLPGGHARLQALDSDTWYAPFSTSLRMSDMGYRNSTQARLGVTANSLQAYLGELAAALTTLEPRYEAIGVLVDGEYRQLSANVLQLENEYYSSIRPKPASKSPRLLTALRHGGVEYVEVRTLDINPFSDLGVNESQTRLIELLLLYCLLGPSAPVSAAEQQEIDQRELAVTWEGRKPGLQLQRFGSPTGLEQWALELLDALESIADAFGDAHGVYAGAVADARKAVIEPERTPSAQVIDALRSRNQTFLQWGLELAARRREEFGSGSLSQQRRRELEDIARQSLDDAQAMARADDAPFDEYLRSYLGTDVAEDAAGLENL